MSLLVESTCRYQFDWLVSYLIGDSSEPGIEPVTSGPDGSIFAV